MDGIHYLWKNTPVHVRPCNRKKVYSRCIHTKGNDGLFFFKDERDRTDHISSRTENTTKNILFHRNERRNERRYFHGRLMCATLMVQHIYTQKCLASFFRRRQTHPWRTSPLQQTLSLTKTVNRKVINLSSRTLNQTEIMLLSKGLKFSPTPYISNNQELTKDIKEYSRKLRLAEYNYNKDTEKEEEFITEPELVRNKSIFNQIRGKNNTLDTACDRLGNIPLEDSEKKKVI